MKADSAKLRHVLVNLLDNAIKFNRTGGKVEISCRENGRVIETSISDEGIGIERENLERIFEPLTQLDPSPTRQYGGTGTGLSVARHIIELHGGQIWAESEVGKGSTFYFTLPMAE